MASNAAHVFEPIYGWGWRQGDHSIDVPETLSVRGSTESDSRLSGVVELPERFSGCLAELSLRSKANGKTQWNVVLSAQSPFVAVTGYVQSTDDV
jgi:hypothetical protein